MSRPSDSTSPTAPFPDFSNDHFDASQSALDPQPSASTPAISEAETAAAVHRAANLATATVRSNNPSRDDPRVSTSAASIASTTSSRLRSGIRPPHNSFASERQSVHQERPQPRVYGPAGTVVRLEHKENVNVDVDEDETQPENGNNNTRWRKLKSWFRDLHMGTACYPTSR